MEVIAFLLPSVALVFGIIVVNALVKIIEIAISWVLSAF